MSIKLILHTYNWVIRRQVPDLREVYVPAVSIVQLDDDVAGVGVGGGHSAWVEVGHVAAPVGAHPHTNLQLTRAPWCHVTNLMEEVG